MNTIENNNYIQYLTLSRIIKTKSVTFVNNGTTTTFVVNGINEEFFILSVFQNNLKVSGVGFENFDNTDMLSVINDNFMDVDLISDSSFLTPLQSVTMSYNNEYVKNQKNPKPDLVLRDNEYLYFKAYLDFKFPNNPYEIQPFMRNSTGISLDPYKLYFCKNSGYYDTLIRTDYLNSDSLILNDSHYLFTSSFTQLGNQSVFQGYVAVFENNINPLPVGGGGALE
ncbi:hypothetical protein ACM55H_11600 [Flavobacterium sp. ZT3R17]|uniref:hypothetical protein n=1 Tax=Flavobacterium cryoconiti TaxID=3398736 RepID=UPI003A88E9FB